MTERPTLEAPARVSNPLEELAQAHEIEALSLLVQTMRDPTVKPEHRLKAAEAVMDRARGKARQPAAKDPRDPKKQKAIALSVDQLLKIVAKASERVAHADASRRTAQVLEGEFTPSPVRRPVNEHRIPAPVPPQPPADGGEDVDDLLK